MFSLQVWPVYITMQVLELVFFCSFTDFSAFVSSPGEISFAIDIFRCW